MLVAKATVFAGLSFCRVTYWIKVRSITNKLRVVAHARVVRRLYSVSKGGPLRK